MNRREALARVALITGGTVVGGHFFLTGCRPSAEAPAVSLKFSPDVVALLDEIGETILPETPSSPGAKAARMGSFMEAIVTDCYTEQEQRIFHEGLAVIDQRATERYSKSFMAIAPAERHDLLVDIDREAKTYANTKKEGEPVHYFSMLKQLTLWGYFTSEEGSKKALRYLPLPGRYEGCIPYTKGDKAWAAI